MGIEDGLPLEIRDGSAEELRRGVQMLLDIEAIKRVKHTYFRCLDTANFDEIEGLFHPEVTVHFVGGTYEWKLEGKREYLDSIRASFHKEAIGHHNGHHPEIRLVSESEATGIWYLADQMWMFSNQYYTAGTALYWDRYVKEDGRWLIRHTKYERIYETGELIKERPRFATHYLAHHGSEPPAT